MQDHIPMKCGRPMVAPPRTMFDLLIELVALTCLLGFWWMMYTAWPTLPAVIPTHFTADGTVNAWGPKSTLIAPVIIGAAMYLMFTILGFFPQYYNYPVKITLANYTRLYRIGRTLMGVMKLEIVLLFTFINWTTIQVALHKAQGLPGWFLPFFLITIFGTLAVSLLAMLAAR